MPLIENVSVPSRPSDWRPSPSLNISGRMPIITKLLRWMRSYVSAITARMPSSDGPLAAQSRELPEPYSTPPMTTVGTPSVM